MPLNAAARRFGASIPSAIRCAKRFEAAGDGVTPRLAFRPTPPLRSRLRITPNHLTGWVFERFRLLRFCKALGSFGLFSCKLILASRRESLASSGAIWRMAMRPKERRDSGQRDLLRGRLDQIVDMKHPPAKLAASIDWGFLETSFGAVYSDGPGQPPLATRLLAGLAILKRMHDLSDEVLCERWGETPYYQLFCGEEVFRREPPFDRSSLTRWRQRMGEETLVALLQESLAVATRAGAAKPSDFSKAIVETTVQEKAVAFPTDARLMHRARERLVRLAKKHGVALRQSYERIGKHALIAHQRYKHAKQHKRANKALRRIRTFLGRVERDIARKIKGSEALRAVFRRPLYLAERVREQRQNQRGKKIYSLHAPEVERIADKFAPSAHA